MAVLNFSRNQKLYTCTEYIIKISAKNNGIDKKFCEFVNEHLDEMLLKLWGLSGTIACKSCRYRQELSNEYLLAKFGVDTKESEPCKVCSFG